MVVICILCVLNVFFVVIVDWRARRGKQLLFLEMGHTHPPHAGIHVHLIQVGLHLTLTLAITHLDHSIVNLTALLKGDHG
jgi:hypothetical protein